MLPSFALPSTGLPAASDPAAFHCTYAYGVAEDLQLRVVIRSAVATQKPDVRARHAERLKGRG